MLLLRRLHPKVAVRHGARRINRRGQLADEPDSAGRANGDTARGSPMGQARLDVYSQSQPVYTFTVPHTGPTGFLVWEVLEIDGATRKITRLDTLRRALDQ